MKAPKKQPIWLTLETIVSTLFILGSIFAINYVEFRAMSWILFILFETLMLLRFIGIFVRPSKRLVRFAVPLGVTILLTCLLLIFQKDDMMIFYIGWLIFICLILHELGLISEFLILRKKEADESLAAYATARKGKTLGEGNYSKRQQDSIMILTGSLLVSAILFSFLLSKYLNPIVSVFACFALFAVLWFFSVIRVTKKEMAFLNEFIRSADFPAFRKKAEEVLSRNLHPETENYVRMVRHIYESAYRDNDSEFETFFVPKNIGYRLTYESIRLDRLWDDERWYTEYRLLKADAALAKKYKNYFETVYLRHEALCRGILEKPIDQIFPLNTKLRYLYATNLYARARYFHSAQEMKKRDEMIAIFQKEFPEMIQLQNHLKEMIQKSDSAD